MLVRAAGTGMGMRTLRDTPQPSRASPEPLTVLTGDGRANPNQSNPILYTCASSSLASRAGKHATLGVGGRGGGGDCA